MSKFKEFGLVLENASMRESIGIEQLVFCKIVLDLERIVSFRESVSDKGDPEPYTVVYTVDGQIYTLDMPYIDFLIIFDTEVEKLVKNKENE